MARKIYNDPISHCPKGQGGRTFSRSKVRGTKGTGSEHVSMRSKTQPKLSNKDRFPFGKYYDWENDPNSQKRTLYDSPMWKRNR